MGWAWLQSFVPAGLPTLLLRSGGEGNKFDLQTAPHCSGILPQRCQGVRMVLTPPTCLKARHCWRLSAHALGHFHLRQPSLLTGTHKGIEEREFFGESVIL